jgi:hypothetical protein
MGGRGKGGAGMERKTSAAYERRKRQREQEEAEEYKRYELGEEREEKQDEHEKREEQEEEGDDCSDNESEKEEDEKEKSEKIVLMEPLACGNLAVYKCDASLFANEEIATDKVLAILATEKGKQNFKNPRELFKGLSELEQKDVKARAFDILMSMIHERDDDMSNFYYKLVHDADDDMFMFNEIEDASE